MTHARKIHSSCLQTANPGDVVNKQNKQNNVISASFLHYILFFKIKNKHTGTS